MKTVRFWRGVGAISLLAFAPIVTAASSSESGIQASIRYFVLTAQTSPNAELSRSNAMERLQHGVAANGPEAVKTNPGALNLPGVLKVCDIVNSPAGYLMWDGTNNPSGAFSSENGKRIGIGLDWKSTNSFLVSDIYFALSSSDPSNSFSFYGNLGTNTDNGSPLSFSRTTLVGEQWDPAGNVTATFTTGLVATNPVNRVLALVRLGWICSDTNILALTLNYFKEHLPFTNVAAFYMQDSNGAVTIGVTNHIESSSRLGASPTRIVLDGQRNVPDFSYTLEGTADFKSWTNVLTGMKDGEIYTNTSPVLFFKTREENASALAALPKSKTQVRVERDTE